MDATVPSNTKHSANVVLMLGDVGPTLKQHDEDVLFSGMDVVLDQQGCWPRQMTWLYLLSMTTKYTPAA